ncbi:hypothetical protein PILCRDRAFT_825284 [Piloderma croceum F 1598]|uniref:Uncharacterized protein n=1 Tax=Piloderma croceum (strain F 1598) TaxID=765440 RepID=A0A0C3EYB3_PILCF|nr:hypothetical protein PILCRDRAFT_825284 [Piloderma croceum F 1598]
MPDSEKSSLIKGVQLEAVQCASYEDQSGKVRVTTDHGKVTDQVRLARSLMIFLRRADQRLKVCNLILLVHPPTGSSSRL